MNLPRLTSTPTGLLRPKPQLGEGEMSRTFQKNLILSLQNTKSNVAALLRERS